MKYLVTGRPGRNPVPSEKAVDLIKAAQEYIVAKFQDGTRDCQYAFADQGGFFITNADSHEAVMDELLEYPLFFYLYWEVKPLCDWSHLYDRLIEGLSSTD